MKGLERTEKGAKKRFKSIQIRSSIFALWRRQDLILDR